MKRYVRVVMVSLLNFLVAGQIVLSVVALGGDPQSLFTDNILSTSPATNVTAMEQVLLDNISAATSTIDLAIYDFNRESVRDALITAANRGAMVRVVTDDDAYSNPSYTPYFTALETAGITGANDSRSSIMHNKFIVIDQEIVWTGSTNITDNGFTYNHNNAAVLTSPLLADIYTIEFNEMFQQGLFGTAKSDNVTHTVDYNGVPIELYFSPTDNPMPEVINEVDAATEDIYFSIFFFTDDELRDALIAKVNQGLTVEGIWDALEASNQYSQDEALCAAGIPIKIEDSGGKMHNKFMIIDAGGSSPTIITGSMNWTGAGGNANDENTLIIHDAEVAQAYLAAYQELYEALGPETLCIAGGNGDGFVYLPLVAKPLPPTATATPSPTVTPSATPTTVPPPTGDVQITEIFYDGIVPRVESDP